MRLARTVLALATALYWCRGVLSFIDWRTVAPALHNAFLQVRHGTQLVYEKQAACHQDCSDQQPDCDHAARVGLLRGFRLHVPITLPRGAPTPAPAKLLPQS
jgi:hypothetical protein